MRRLERNEQARSAPRSFQRGHGTALPFLNRTASLASGGSESHPGLLGRRQAPGACRLVRPSLGVGAASCTNTALLLASATTETVGSLNRTTSLACGIGTPSGVPRRRFRAPGARNLRTSVAWSVSSKLLTHRAPPRARTRREVPLTGLPPLRADRNAIRRCSCGGGLLEASTSALPSLGGSAASCTPTALLLEHHGRRFPNRTTSLASGSTAAVGRLSRSQASPIRRAGRTGPPRLLVLLKSHGSNQAGGRTGRLAFL